MKTDTWTAEADASLVKYIALHADMLPESGEWPAVKENHPYWQSAIQQIVNDGNQIRTGNHLLWTYFDFNPYSVRDQHICAV